MPSREEMLENQDIIDEEVFMQLIELDEDGGTEFLEGVAGDWFEQAEETFGKMDKRLSEKDVLEFSKRAHYLKGSSGQLGVVKLQASCATLQHLGELWDEEKDPSRKKTLSTEEAVKRIEPVLARAKKEYAAAEKWLKAYLEGGEGYEPDKEEDNKDSKDKPEEKESTPKKADTASPTAVTAEAKA